MRALEGTTKYAEYAKGGPSLSIRCLCLSLFVYLGYFVVDSLVFWEGGVEEAEGA